MYAKGVEGRRSNLGGGSAAMQKLSHMFLQEVQACSVVVAGVQQYMSM